MAKAETDISNNIRMALSKIGARIFRNHRGKHLTLDGKRVVTTGLFDGASDLIGWTPVTVTSEMVGSTIAVFTSIEVKVGDKKPTTEQSDWLEAVHQSGGIAIVGRSPDMAVIQVEELVRAMSRIRIRC